jgi:uncharacterized protein YkwD
MRFNMKKYRFQMVLIVVSIILSSCSARIEKTRFSAVCISEPDSLSTLELDVLHEINLARTNPKLYSNFIKEKRKLFKGKNYWVSSKLYYVTVEGTAALDEAIEFLENTSPAEPLDIAGCLCLAARDHVADMLGNNFTDHNSSDGTDYSARIDRFIEGTIFGSGENIHFGSNDAREIVIDLIVDDGVPGRGHRKNIFNPEYRQVGIACGNHNEYRYSCVMDFSATFIESEYLVLEKKMR